MKNLAKLPIGRLLQQAQASLARWPSDPGHPTQDPGVLSPAS